MQLCTWPKLRPWTLTTAKSHARRCSGRCRNGPILCGGACLSACMRATGSTPGPFVADARLQPLRSRARSWLRVHLRLYACVRARACASRRMPACDAYLGAVVADQRPVGLGDPAATLHMRYARDRVFEAPSQARRTTCGSALRSNGGVLGAADVLQTMPAHQGHIHSAGLERPSWRGR